MAVMNSTGTIYYSKISGVVNLLDKDTTDVMFDDAVVTGVTSNVASTADLSAEGPPDGAKLAKISVASTANAGIIASKRLLDAAGADATVDCSAFDAVTFWIKTSVAVASGDFTFILSSATLGTTPKETLTIPALAANTWYRLVLRLNNPSLDTAILSMAINMVVDIATIDIYIYEPRLMTEFLGQKSFNITETVEQYDTSDYQSGDYREFEATFSNWTVSFEGHKEGAPPLEMKQNYVIGIAETEDVGRAFVGNGFYTSFNPSGNFAEAIQYPYSIQGSRFLHKPGF